MQADLSLRWAHVILLVLSCTCSFSNVTESYDNHCYFFSVSAVQDLWDFSPDEEDYESSHDTSQEDDGDMDTS